MFRNEKEEYLLQVDFGIEQTPEFRRLMQRVTTEEYLKLVEARSRTDFSAQDIKSPKWKRSGIDRNCVSRGAGIMAAILKRRNGCDLR